MKQQTAVEWLHEAMSENVNGISPYILELLEQAKAMEKEQIVDAFVECWKENMPDGYECKQSAEQYYIDTYQTF